jgi:hypothetical protein
MSDPESIEILPFMAPSYSKNFKRLSNFAF